MHHFIFKITPFHIELKTNTVEETVFKRFHSRLKNDPNFIVSALGSDYIPSNPLRKQKKY